MISEGLWWLNLLLDLMAAVSWGEVYDQLQLASGVSYVLILKLALLGLVRPRKPFVGVDCEVNTTNADKHSPSDCFEKLKMQILLKDSKHEKSKILRFQRW